MVSNEESSILGFVGGLSPVRPLGFGTGSGGGLAHRLVAMMVVSMSVHGFSVTASGAALPPPWRHLPAPGRLFLPGVRPALCALVAVSTIQGDELHQMDTGSIGWQLGRLVGLPGLSARLSCATGDRMLNISYIPVWRR